MKLFLLSLISFLLINTPSFAQSNGKVLVVLSSANSLTLKDGKAHPTGFYLSELAIPLTKILKMGYQVVYANPKGNLPVMDAHSDSDNYFKSSKEHAQARALIASQQQLQHPRQLSSINDFELSSFDAIFVPGGHAPMEDLYRDPNLGRILRHFHQYGKPTGLICHGPVALLSANQPNSPWIYSGYNMTVFSTAEEKVAEAKMLGGAVRFYADAAMGSLGGKMYELAPWSVNVIVDRELVTGQNPQSADLFADRFMTTLVAKKFRETRLEGFLGNITPGVAYAVIGHPNAMQTGYTYIFAGAKKQGMGADQFIKAMTTHVQNARNAFGTQGLKGYFFIANQFGEFAYMNWTSKEAADKAFKSPEAQPVVKEAGALMDMVTFIPR